MSQEYNVIYIQEHRNGLIDQRIIVMYDEDKFWVYGSRDPHNRADDEDGSVSEYAPYYFQFTKENFGSLCFLMKFILDEFHCRVTIEVHNINIDDDDLNDVDFDYLECQMDKHNEIVAYDKIRLSGNKLRNILNTIIS
jgi:hypothetical protein